MATQLEPLLRAGDRLTGEEFLRRYEAAPEIRKAELLGGIVHKPSPVSDFHGDPHMLLAGCLVVYRAATLGVLGGDNTTIILDGSDMVQPDLHLRLDPALGGQVQVKGLYPFGPPELVVEISVSTEPSDLNEKRQIYEQAGVREYLIWRVEAGRLTWLVQGDAGFVSLEPGPDGIHRSQVFPGLWLEEAALPAGDAKRLLEVVQQGIASPEHAAFVDELASRSRLSE